MNGDFINRKLPPQKQHTTARKLLSYKICCELAIIGQSPRCEGIMEKWNIKIELLIYSQPSPKRLRKYAPFQITDKYKPRLFERQVM